MKLSMNPKVGGGQSPTIVYPNKEWKSGNSNHPLAASLPGSAMPFRIASVRVRPRGEYGGSLKPSGQEIIVNASFAAELLRILGHHWEPLATTPTNGVNERPSVNMVVGADQMADSSTSSRFRRTAVVSLGTTHYFSPPSFTSSKECYLSYRYSIIITPFKCASLFKMVFH